MATSVKNVFREIDNGDTTVAAALTSLGEFDVSDFTYVSVSLKNVGTLTDQFEVAIRVHDDASYGVIHNAAGDFTTPTGIVIAASEDPLSIANGDTAVILFDVRGVHTMRLRAASSGADTTVTTHIGGN